MTVNGWIQIALFCAIVIAITRPFGGYMTRVFDGERTFLTPGAAAGRARDLLAAAASTRSEEQHWLTYAVAMLFFSVAGFVTLYALQRLQDVLPFNPQGQTGGRAEPRLQHRGQLRHQHQLAVLRAAKRR